MLGACSLLWEGRVLPLGSEAANKPVQLLQMLLYYRTAGVSRADAISNLFDVQGQANPVNNLRNTRFRLKRLLESVGLPPCEYVLVRGGRLYWNPQVPYVLDTELFEKAARHAQREKNNARRLPALLGACALFNGPLLPAQSALPWAVQEGLRLKKLYFALLRQAGGMLEQQQDYPGAAGLYTRGAALEPYEEEWRIDLIRCEQRQGHHREALAEYEKTIGLFLDEFGVAPSEEFRRCIDNTDSSTGFSSALEIRDCIARGYSGGAYFCHFAEFVHCCSLVSRLDLRSGRATSLIWCAVIPPLNEAGDPTRRKERMAACMRETLHATLRNSDVFTRYGDNQYLILLPGSGNENCELVFERLNARFKEDKASYGYTLSLHTVPLAPPPAESL